MKRITTFLIQILAFLWLSTQISIANESIVGKSMDAIFSEASNNMHSERSSVLSTSVKSKQYCGIIICNQLSLSTVMFVLFEKAFPRLLHQTLLLFALFFLFALFASE